MDKTYSIIRYLEYKILESLTLDGKVLDIGGSKRSDYHKLIGGNHEIITANIDSSYGCDLVFDVEKEFPIESASYDYVLSMNVLEHIFEYQNVFAEVGRVLKSGGKFILTTPFIYMVHGSPDDYFRYTKSALIRLAQKNNFEVERIEEMGQGIFSILYQNIGGWIPTNFLRIKLKFLFMYLDKALYAIPKYKKLAKNIPLGYYTVLIKK